MTYQELGLRTLNGDFVVTRFVLEEEEVTVDREVDRAPFSDYWFEYGSLQFEPSRLSFRITIRGATMAAADALLASFTDAAKAATTLVWGDQQRPVAGLTGPWQVAPVLRGYAVSCQFTATGDWQAFPGGLNEIGRA